MEIIVVQYILEIRGKQSKANDMQSVWNSERENQKQEGPHLQEEIQGDTVKSSVHEDSWSCPKPSLDVGKGDNDKSERHTEMQRQHNEWNWG